MGQTHYSSQKRAVLRWVVLLLGFYLALSYQARIAQAQWTDNGSDLTTSDNVGIGTTSPAEKLDVRGNLNLGATGIESTLKIYSGANTGTGSFGRILTRPSGGLEVFGGGGSAAEENTFYISAHASPGADNLYSLGSSSLRFSSLYIGTGNSSFAGNVGIGTTSPTTGYKLDIVQPQDNIGQHGLRVLAGFTAADNVVYFTSNPSLGYDFVMKATGNVGIGTMEPDARLHVYGNGNKNYGVLGLHSTSAGGDGAIAFLGPYAYINSDAPGDSYWSWGHRYNGDANAWVRTYPGLPLVQTRLDSGGNFRISTDTSTTSSPPSFTDRFIVTNAGNVGIGTTTPSTKFHVVGDITVTGNIAAKYQDVAEWVTSPKAMPAGTVVMLHPEQTNQVLPSIKAYDTRVAGVISEMPGILLGEAGDGKVKIATTGRVKVKVDATKKPVQVGDLLVTSDKEGVAMKSEPLDLGGVPIHRPGTLIGKALESLKEGEGEILVLLSLQ